MIPFFKKTRKKMADQNRPLKYMRYAIGEIVLVVIGILIALSINNWNESRKELKQEVVILRQLKSEFESNLTQLDEKIDSKSELIASSLRLFDFIDHPEKRTKDSIDYHLARTTPFTTFDPIINDMSSSGSLRLIKNERLKELLSYWTTETIQVKEDETSWTLYRNNFYIPFLIKNYQLRTIRSVASKSNVLGKYLIEDKNDYNDKVSIGESVFTEDFNLLLNNADYEDHLERCYSINKFARAQSLILRRTIIEILELLEKELEKAK